MATHQRSATDTPYARTERSDPDTLQSASSEEYLELLGDEYTRRVLSAIIEEPRTGREIIDATDISKPTVYRRLNRLEDVGLVDTEQRLDLDGHHCKQFVAVVEAIDFEFGADGIRVSIDAETRTAQRTPNVLIADD